MLVGWLSQNVTEKNTRNMTQIGKLSSLSSLSPVSSSDRKSSRESPGQDKTWPAITRPFQRWSRLHGEAGSPQHSLLVWGGGDAEAALLGDGVRQRGRALLPDQHQGAPVRPGEQAGVFSGPVCSQAHGNPPAAFKSATWSEFFAASQSVFFLSVFFLAW